MRNSRGHFSLKFKSTMNLYHELLFLLLLLLLFIQLFLLLSRPWNFIHFSTHCLVSIEFFLWEVQLRCSVWITCRWLSFYGWFFRKIILAKIYKLIVIEKSWIGIAMRYQSKITTQQQQKLSFPLVVIWEWFSVHLSQSKCVARGKISNVAQEMSSSSTRATFFNGIISFYVRERF